MVRYGNVAGSRGSVIPLFLEFKKRKMKEFPVTDQRMTRFWITLTQSVDLVIKALEGAEGGEIFVPRIPSMRIIDLVKAIDPDCKIKIIGIRPGEKLHEVLVSVDEARKTKIVDGLYVILPQYFEKREVHKEYEKFVSVPEGFVYCSNENEKWVTTEELKGMLE